MQRSKNLSPIADKIEQLLLDPYSEESKQYAVAKDRAAAQEATISEVVYLEQQSKIKADESEAVEYHEKQLKAEATQYAAIYAFEQEQQQQLMDALRSQALAQDSIDAITTMEQFVKQFAKAIDHSLKQIETQLTQNQEKRVETLKTWKNKKETHAKEAVKKLAKPFVLSDGTSFTLDENSERAQRIQDRITDMQLPSEMERIGLLPARDSFQRHIAIYAEFMQGIEEANPNFNSKQRPVGFVRAITMQLNQINFKLIKKDAEDIDRNLKTLNNEDNRLYSERGQVLQAQQLLTATITAYQSGNLTIASAFISNELTVNAVDSMIEQRQQMMISVR